MQSRFHPIHTGQGKTVIGDPASPGSIVESQNRVDEVLRLLESIEGLGVVVERDPENLQRALILKVLVCFSFLFDLTSLVQSLKLRLTAFIPFQLLINAVLNSLTALIGTRNGNISKSAHGRQLCLQMCDEIELVLGGDLGLDAIGMAGEVTRVAEATAGNRNSMEGMLLIFAIFLVGWKFGAC